MVSEPSKGSVITSGGLLKRRDAYAQNLKYSIFLRTCQSRRAVAAGHEQSETCKSGPLLPWERPIMDSRLPLIAALLAAFFHPQAQSATLCLNCPRNLRARSQQQHYPLAGWLSLATDVR